MNDSAAAPSTPARPPRFVSRVGFGALLSLTMGIGPYVLYVLSTLAPAITRDLGLTRTQLGSLVTVSFGVATLFSVLSGGMSDRLGSRRLLFLLYGCTGVALAGIALGPTFGWLVAATALAGFSQSSSNPVTNRLVAKRVPAGHRGLLLGVKQSGVQMSQFFAGAVLPSAALVMGWRGAAGASVAFVVVGLVATWLLVPAEPPQPTPVVRGSSGRSRDPMIPWLAGYGLLIGIIVQGTNVYLPLYSFEELGFNQQLAGATAGVVGAMGIVARILWGRGAERLRTAVSPLLILAALSVAATSLLWGAASLGPVALWTGAALFAVSALASTVVLMLAVVRGVSAERTGRASGQVMLGLYAGFMIGPVLFGSIVDATDGYGAAWGLLTGCAATATVLCTTWWYRTQGES